MKPNREATRSGFAMALGLALLALVAVVILMLSRQLSHEIHRTTTAYQNAQTRQLLFAGALSLKQHASQWNIDRWKGEAAGENWDVALPSELFSPAEVLVIRCSSDFDGQVKADLAAASGARSWSHTLRLKWVGGRWLIDPLSM
jgi:hypothetical protein